jgi:hypothetical protein
MRRERECEAKANQNWSPFLPNANAYAQDQMRQEKENGFQPAPQFVLPAAVRKLLV